MAPKKLLSLAQTKEALMDIFVILEREDSVKILDALLADSTKNQIERTKAVHGFLMRAIQVNFIRSMIKFRKFG